MKHAKVSELKARLSAYLADVRSGATVVVCDRRTPIARIVPIDDNLDDVRIDEPRRPLADLRSVTAVRPRRRIHLGRLLRESRDQR